MSILLPLLTGIAACTMLCTAVSAQQQDTTNPAAPEFRLEEHNGRYQMRQVFPSVPNRTAPVSSATLSPSPITTAELERSVATAAANQWKSEIHAIVNPTDSNNILAMTMISSEVSFTDIAVYATENFGTTWEETLTLPNAGDPILAADTKGTLYLFHLARTQGVQLYYRYSTDKGKTWQTPANNKISQGSSNDKEWVAVDRTNSPYKNTVYVAFLSNVAIGSQTIDDHLVLYTKHPDSSSFSQTPVLISDDSFSFAQLVTIDVASDGTLHTVFSGSRSNTEKIGLWHTMSTDGGKTFTQPKRIIDLACTLSEYFEPKFRVPGYRSIFNSQLAANQTNGELYLIWHDIVRQNDEAIASNIYFSRSRDRGTTWSTPQTLNSQPSTPGLYHYEPSIVAASNGTLCASWYDGGGAQNSTEVHVSVAYSSNGGVSFAPKVKASTAPANLTTMESSISPFTVGHYTQIACTDNYAIPFWSDGRTGNAFNLYCAFVPLNPASTSVQRIVRMNQNAVKLAIAPNPMSDNATITLALAAPSQLQLRITDVTGKTVAIPLDEHCPVGETQIQIAASSLVPGVYFCSVYTDGILAVSQQITVQH